MDETGYEAIVEAWKLQVAVYPHNAAIIEGISWAFSGHEKHFKEGLDLLKLALKKHPQNGNLKQRLKAMKNLNNIWQR